MTFCNSCGARFEDKIQFCGNCGRRIEEHAPLLERTFTKNFNEDLKLPFHMNLFADNSIAMRWQHDGSFATEKKQPLFLHTTSILCLCLIGLLCIGVLIISVISMY